MNRFVFKEGIVWVALVVLTLVGFAMSDSREHGFAYFALGAGLVKFFLIFLDFMEMKHAHRAWRVAMGAFVLALVAAIAVTRGAA